MIAKGGNSWNIPIQSWSTWETYGWHEAAWAASRKEGPDPASSIDTELSSPKDFVASTALNDEALIEPPSCSAKTNVLIYMNSEKLSWKTWHIHWKMEILKYYFIPKTHPKEVIWKWQSLSWNM